MAYPFVSAAEFKRIKARIKAKKAKREAKRLSNAILDAYSGKRIDTRYFGLPTVFSVPPAANGEAPPSPAKVKAGRKRTKRSKKSLFVRLRDALDKEAQSYAAKRDEALGCRIAKANQCTGRSEVGYHLLPRGKWAVRWDLDFMGVGNIVGSCSPCNAGERWHRLDYGERHRELFGDEFYDALWAKANDPNYVKHTSTGMQAMLDKIRKLKTEFGAA